MRLPPAITLARWLGPWADSTRSPRVSIADHDVDGMRVRVFGTGGKPFLIAPGLHYAGADDPRMDRFCRILASAGHLVVAPYIPSFLALRPDAKAKHDFARAFAALPRWTAERPVVFSISFGSLLAFHLAAEGAEASAGSAGARSAAKRGEASIDRLVVFGGYADFRDMLKFCLTGEVVGRVAARDPLNQPVVLMNLLHLIECADREAVVAGWRRYVERTWGRPEMKARDRFVAIAEELAPDVPAPVRGLFLIGIGAQPGATPLALDALTRFDASELDPAPYLPRVRCRVDLVHGTDDDVIPFEHSHALAKALPNADVRVHITGLYGHTGASKPGVSMIARELATMVRVLLALSLLACGDNSVPESADPRSGERLKLVHWEFADGTRQRIPNELHDAARDEPCTVQRWSDGLAYCTPAAATAVYTDGTCTVEVGRIPQGQPTPRYVQHMFFVGGAFLPSRLYEAGPPTAAPGIPYELRGGSCLFAPPDTGDSYVELGAEVPSSELVHVTRIEFPTEDRVGILVDRSADGLQTPAALVDRDRGEPCVIERSPDAETTRCIPELDTLSIDYRDAACTESVVAVPFGTAVPDVIATPGTCISYRPLGDLTLANSVFTKIGDVCTEVPVPSTTRVFELGPPLDLPVLSRVRADGARIATIEDMPDIVDRFVFDRELGVDCAVDGDRCIPNADDGLIRYSDSDCMTQVIVAAHPLDSCGPPTRFARRGDDVFPILGPSPTVYEISTADVCTSLSLPGFTYGELGPALTTLATATRVVDD